MDDRPDLTKEAFWKGSLLAVVKQDAMLTLLAFESRKIKKHSIKSARKGINQ